MTTFDLETDEGYDLYLAHERVTAEAERFCKYADLALELADRSDTTDAYREILKALPAHGVSADAYEVARMDESVLGVLQNPPNSWRNPRDIAEAREYFYTEFPQMSRERVADLVLCLAEMGAV